MAYLEMHYFSKALQVYVTLNVILPEIHKKKEGVGRPNGSYKTLYLLHGLSGDHTVWMRRTSIERYAEDYGIAVVMPEVGRSWYADTAYGLPYFTFITQELPAVCRGYFKEMSPKREDNFIAGLSMGGYGAMKAALTYPENYGGCASLSGALDITRIGRPYRLEEWQGNFDFALKSAEELEGGDLDIYSLIRRNCQEGKPFPKMFLWCGTEDTLLPPNRRCHTLLDELNIPHFYGESEGDHTWQWWDLHIQDVLRYLFGEEEP